MSLSFVQFPHHGWNHSWLEFVLWIPSLPGRAFQKEGCWCMFALCDVISGCHQNKHFHSLICPFTWTCSCCLCYAGLRSFGVAELNQITLPQDRISSFQWGQKADQTLSAIAQSPGLMEHSGEEIRQEEKKRIVLSVMFLGLDRI